MKYSNILYFYHVNSLGGVETFFYYLAKKYQDLDITILFNSGDPMQLLRLSKYCRVKKYQEGEVIECKRAFFNYNTSIIDYVIAEEYIQIVHADYSVMNLSWELNPKITKYLGVSQVVCDAFKKVTGKDIELCYNPVCIDKPEKLLKLVSATRLTSEKGKDRMIKLMQVLSKNQVRYEWQIFTNDTNVINDPSVIYRKPRLDIIDYIADSDYLVQLSDSEAYCYSVVESLIVGTPVIVTDCPVYKELGIQSGVHGVILDFDMKNIPLETILSSEWRFTYKAPDDNWSEYLASDVYHDHHSDSKLLVDIECISSYFDLELGKRVERGSQYLVTKVRADYLVSLGLVKYI